MRLFMMPFTDLLAGLQRSTDRSVVSALMRGRPRSAR
jgi:hypothetical protein